MAFDDAVRDRQAQPGSFAHWFRSEEWIENSLYVIRYNPRAGVAKRSNDMIALGTRANAHLTIRLSDSLSGVHQQVHPDLIEERGVAIYLGQLAIVAA